MPAITRTAVLLTAAALIFPAATAQAAPADSRHGAPRAGETITQPLQAALKSLTIKDEDRTGYQRTSFKHWVDADEDGCTTRAEVLKAEALTAPDQGPSAS
ncbi:hypothetical protein [Streptomyces sp. NPDC058268]|uniref:hypothetical protein n=1 Tax=Streptomyces sp. NPDC058268 TaxID=3346413 RepID=UPI0036E24273